MCKLKAGFIIIFLFIAQPEKASAGIFNMFMSGGVKYTIDVVDENNQPIPAATFWVILSTDKTGTISPALIERLATRYSDAKNADYVHDLNLHPELLVEYSNAKGTLTLDIEENDFGRTKHLPISIAVIKRGYKSSVYSADTPVNTRHKIKIKLTKNADEQVDPRLLEFDLWRAQAEDTSIGVMSENRATMLMSLHNSVRTLAQTFEAENNPDAASKLYNYLAHMPSVKTSYSSSGELQIHGYVNGFQDTDPKRVRDLHTSWELNQENAQIKFERELHLLEEKRISASKEEKYSLLAEEIKLTENYLRENGNSAWPKVWKLLVDMYKANKADVNNACDALIRFKKFEPDYYYPEEWKSRAEEIKVSKQMHEWRKLKIENTTLSPSDVHVEFTCEGFQEK